MSTSLVVGRKAPAFSLPDQDGQTVKLSDLKGQWVVLYFYPKDDTPGCTVEACSFRDAYEDFKEAGAEVVGISSDSAAAHRAFADRHKLPFLLVADEGGRVRKLYGVPSTFGLFPGRVTYVIDPEGVVRHIYSSQLRATNHSRESLAVARALRSGAARA